MDSVNLMNFQFKDNGLYGIFWNNELIGMSRSIISPNVSFNDEEEIQLQILLNEEAYKNVDVEALVAITEQIGRLLIVLHNKAGIVSHEYEGEIKNVSMSGRMEVFLTFVGIKVDFKVIPEDTIIPQFKRRAIQI